MTISLILIATMLASTILDGWSQHKMLAVNGGKGIEVTTIYGKNPTYFRYFAYNIPAWAFYSLLIYLMPALAAKLIFTIGFCAFHVYGFLLNKKNF